MIRNKIIPLAWLLTAMLIIGGAFGAQAHADPVNPAVRQYVEWNHEKICVTAALTSIPETVARVWSDSLFLTRAESQQAVQVSILVWCPQHTNAWNTYQHRVNRWILK